MTDTEVTMREHTFERAVTGRRGFTLVEMLTAMVMFAALGLVATNFMLKQGAAVARTTEVASATQGVRAAFGARREALPLS